jgi:hypothetical protein
VAACGLSTDDDHGGEEVLHAQRAATSDAVKTVGRAASCLRDRLRSIYDGTSPSIQWSNLTLQPT